MAIIRLVNIEKSFENEKVLGGINLEVDKGESIGIAGPNGCGKTTLLKIIYGILKPDKGEVKVMGKMGYVPQKNMLLPWKTIKDNITLHMKLKKYPKEKIEEKLAITASIFSLEDHLEKYPKEVSGGTARKAAIARSLMTDPDILLLDEPFTGLDKGSVKSLIKSLKKLKIMGVTIVIVSHQYREMMEIVEKIYRLGYKPAKIEEIIEVEK